MVQSWTNADQLYLKFGTSKTTAENWGDYVSPNGNRVIEGLVDISTLTTVGSTVGILSDTVFFPPAGNTSASTALGIGANSNSWFIEKVELVAETAMSSTVATISLGLIQTDRATVPTSYSSALVAAVTGATLVQGALVTLGATITGAGNCVGQLATVGPLAATGPYYITGSCNTASITGKIRVRISYRGIGTITQ